MQSLGSIGSFSSLSQSTPLIPRNVMDSRKHYVDNSPPPKYSELPSIQRNGSASTLTQRGFTSSMQGMSTSQGISPLNRRVLTQSFKPGQQQQHPLLANGHMSSDQSLFSSSRSGRGQGPSPTPSAGAYTSASVLILYIGPVEIPESWSTRELSSQCLKECTRRLLSQRQEFIEAFLDVDLQSFKILNVSQAPLFKHKREELYYCGACTNDEQYFGIVTQKVSSKSGKKSSPGSSGRVPRAGLCHVFKVIQHKSVLVLRNNSSPSGKGKSSQHVQPKTVPVMSCVTIIHALQGLFTGESAGSGKLFGSDPSLKGVNPVTGGSNESMSGSKKKLEVVDLRPSAFVAPASRSSYLTSNKPPTANPNIYVSGNGPVPARSAPHPVHTRSHSKGEYPQAFGTPAFHQRSTQGSSGSGGGGTWYSVDSPKENHHGRQPSWEGSRSYTSPGDRPNVVVPPKGGSLGSSSRRGRPGPQFDAVRKMSDDSSVSSLSDSRASSPTKLSFRSSYASRSRTPSPTRSPSCSSGSRSSSPSPVRTRKRRSPATAKTTAGAGSSVRPSMASLDLELSSVRALSPTRMMMMSATLRGSRAMLKRQVCTIYTMCTVFLIHS